MAGKVETGGGNTRGAVGEVEEKNEEKGEGKEGKQSLLGGSFGVRVTRLHASAHARTQAAGLVSRHALQSSARSCPPRLGSRSTRSQSSCTSRRAFAGEAAALSANSETSRQTVSEKATNKDWQTFLFEKLFDTR